MDLPSMEEQREEGILRVEDAMRPATETRCWTARRLLDHALQGRMKESSDVLLVRLNPTGWSSISREELEAMVEEGKGEPT